LNKTETDKNWFSRAKAEADKGVPSNDRVVGVAIVVVSILTMLYFAAHQVWSTDFFTAAFGTVEAIMLYGNLTAWVVTGFLEGVLGQRLLSRLFDVFGGIIFITLSLAWLTVVFPFNFCLFRRCFAGFPQVPSAVDIQRHRSRTNDDWGHSVYYCSSLFASSVQVRQQGTI